MPAAAQAPTQPAPAAPAPRRGSTRTAASGPAECRPPEVANAAKLTNAIEAAEKTIQHLTELEEELGRLRIDVECILSDSAQTAETLRPQLAAVKSQIDKLGPPPAKDAPPEAAAIAAERARLAASPPRSTGPSSRPSSPGCAPAS